KRLEIGLLWWKDCVMEAVNMVHSGDVSNTVANMGDPHDRFVVLGGWIYNKRHKSRMSNEAWWHLIKSLEPIPDNVENRFVRLCNDFDDLESFLSFVAFGMPRTPPRFLDEDPELDSRISRNTLSLSGVAVTDIISANSLPFPFPSTHPASGPGLRTWGELESRAYIFGAVRDGNQLRTGAFLKELRARPDLFYVVTHSEADAPGKMETFGNSSELAGQIQYRSFEAPASGPSEAERGEWKVARSATDILYGTDPNCLGYLTSLERGGSYARGWFFRFKQFAVKYFVIMDAKPHRHAFHVFRAAAWAALRAQGLADGEYSKLKFARASDILFQKAARERLSWMPAGYGGWSATSYEEELRSKGSGLRPTPGAGPDEPSDVAAQSSQSQSTDSHRSQFSYAAQSSPDDFTPISSPSSSLPAASCAGSTPSASLPTQRTNEMAPALPKLRGFFNKRR
ncbi:hypothetical protein WG66_010740, partial [Moniliophthora roreri]